MEGTILVTGGSGFIGTHLVDLLQRYTNLKVVNFDLVAPHKEAHRRHWVQGDIMRPDDLHQAFADFHPNLLIHLAARTDMDGKTVEDYAINSAGTRNVVDAIVSSGQVERAIFVSTQFVVGPGPLPRHDLDFRAHTIYGESKVLAELAIQNGNLDCIWTIVRPTNVWGSWHPRYPREFWRVLQAGLYLHPGSRPVTRSYGYVGNVVAQMGAILDAPRDAVHRKVLYVGDPPIELLDWVNAFSLQLTGRRARVIPQNVVRLLAWAGDFFVRLGIKFPIFSSRLKSMTEDYVTPMEPTFALLGPPVASLEQGVMETVQWLRTADTARR